MSQLKTTPGPWEVGRTNVAGVTYIMADDDIVVAEIERDERTEADASLIAAAPELYEALDAIISFGGLSVAKVEAAKAALAKARGEQS